MVLILLFDLPQRLINELVSGEALVGVGVSKHRFHATANRWASAWAERVLTLGPRIRQHICSKAGLERSFLSEISLHPQASGSGPRKSVEVIRESTRRGGFGLTTCGAAKLVPDRKPIGTRDLGLQV